jgi:SAM-dependent methyltransferase
MSEKDEHPGEDRRSIADRFNRAHSARLQSPTLERVWLAAYGQDYPEEVKPNAFYSRSTLLRLRAGLHIDAGATVVDLGCGNGGVGLWIAAELGTKLIGIDLSAGGVAAASERAAKLGLGDRAQFLEGDLTATGLPSASCDAAISLDVLCFVPDKPAAINEMRRILRPGARFAFTTWEQEGYSARLKTAQLADHRPVLTEAGFDIELYEEPPDWRRQQRAVLEGLLASEQDLAAELERLTVDRFMNMARGMLAEMPDRRYVSAIARRH